MSARAAAVAVGVVLLVAAMGQTGKRSTGGSSERPVDGAALRGSDASERPAIRAAARRFLTAFARYETGRLNRRTVAELRATAHPALARALLAQPARVPAGTRVKPRRVGRFYRPLRHGDQLKIMSRLGDDRIELRLARDGNRWLVTGLG